ncbi:hypothetical protein SEA_EMOTION_30 [Arthrobacter phage Emotion]|uniref:Lipoprotein n=1 Tax=Arthrobacter phage Emotion TaxID=3038361 RepID=A0AA49ET89_9CAUD|nr:hypothetical protein SEA_EMOTION_30 [Arthrobacter phage Emotion]
MNRPTITKAIALAGALAVALGLGACAAPGPRPTEPSDALAAVSNSAGEGSLYEVPVTLSDGRKVICVTFVGHYKGGVSCDWEGAK